MLNKKGFTLVELLVTIVIMLTILALAIVSYVNISDRKKVEAFNQIKAQAELAAEQYFQSNNYLLRELTDDDKEVIVSIGKLVKDDYLNKVIDPSTGEPLDECSYVSVKKNKNGYNYIFVRDPREKVNGTCDNNDFTIVQDNSPKAPDADVEFFTLKNSKEEKISVDIDSWLNIDKLGEKGTLKIVIKPKSSSPITKVTYKLNGEAEKTATKSGDNYYFLVEKDSIERNMPITVANESGKEFKTYVGWNKDTSKPYGTISVDSAVYNYSSNKVNVSFKVDDDVSGVEKLEFNSKEYSEFDSDTSSQKILNLFNYMLWDELDGTSFDVNADLYDVAGNKGVTNSQTYVLYHECTTNVVEKVAIQPKWTSCDKNNVKYYVGWIVYDDSISNKRCDSKSEFYSATCETTPPDCPSLTSSRLPGDTGKNGWYNKGIRFNITPANNTSKWVFKTDNGSGGYTTWKTHKGTDSNNDHTLTGNGAERKVQIEVYNSSGAKRTCNYGPYKIDTTPPTIKYNYYKSAACPGDPSPSSRPGVQASFVVTDNLSGLNSNSVKYYYDGKANWTNQSIYISGKISDTQKTFSKTSTYSNYGNCKVGNSVSRSICYYNHIRATDVAGNVTTVNSSSCKYPGP